MQRKQQITYSPKQVRQVSHRATENVLLIVMAILADKYKFDEDKLERFMMQVQMASTSIDDNVLNRTEILEIIKKHTGFEMEGQK